MRRRNLRTSQPVDSNVGRVAVVHVQGFTYPAPEGYEKAKLSNSAASWNENLGEFVLSCEAVRPSHNSEAALLAILTVTFNAACDLLA